jgi:Lipase (class 3)
MLEQGTRNNLTEDLCPRAIAYEAALLVERAYRQNLTEKIVDSDTLINYIRSIATCSGQYLNLQGKLNPVIRMTTQVGVDARLEVVGSELKIGIAGTNSWGDWLINFGHIKDSLIAHLSGNKDDPSYRVSYETLAGYIFNFLFFYQKLIDAGAVEEITSITIAGHSAGARVADWLALALAQNYQPGSNSLPVQLFTFASPLFKELFTQQTLDVMGINLIRYAIANDLISELPARLFNCDRTFVQLLPAVSLRKRPHRLEHFIAHLKT